MRRVPEQQPATRWIENTAIGLIVTVLGGLAVWGIQQSLTPDKTSGTTPGTKTTTPTGRPYTRTPLGHVEGGTYTGLAIQSSKHAKAWWVSITFSSDRGVIQYDQDGSAKSCRGTLSRQQNGNWLERITMGTCDDGGRWQFSQVGPKVIHGNYQPPSGAYEVAAELTAKE